MSLLEATAITREYEGRAVLKEVSLAVDCGTVLGLIGPTGAGKTTLLRILDLLETPTSGRVRFQGVDATSSARTRLEARRRMSYVQQRPILFSMSVYDNVACALKWRNVAADVIRKRVEGALEQVDMHEHSTRNAKTLSGGETQRVAIARALVSEPEVLFLDEPTANLDPVSASKVQEVISEVLRDNGVAVIMATHDMVQGQQMASEIGVLLDGQLMQVGSPCEIFHSPTSQRVAEFVGMGNLLPGTVAGSEGCLLTMRVGGGLVQAVCDDPLAGDVYVLVRPEDITVSLSGTITSARNRFHGTIVEQKQAGPLVRLEIDCGFRLAALVTASSANELGLEIGQEVFATFKATAARVIRRAVLSRDQ